MNIGINFYPIFFWFFLAKQKRTKKGDPETLSACRQGCTARFRKELRLSFGTTVMKNICSLMFITGKKIFY